MKILFFHCRNDISYDQSTLIPLLTLHFCMIKQLSIQCFLSFNFLNINLCMFKHDELEERFRHSRHDSAERNKSRGLEVRVLVLGNLEVRLIVLEVRISIWVLVLGNLDFGKLEFRAFGNLVLGNLNLKSEVKLNV